MTSRDKQYVDSYDFMLVTTYIPVLSLCVRSTLFVFTVHWLTVTFWLPWHVLVVFAACVVYIDACMMKSLSVDRACGYLCMCALAVLAQPSAHVATACTEGTAFFLMGQNLVWSFLSTFEIVSCVTGVHAKIPFIAKVVIVSIMALMHASIACTPVGVLEMMCRAIVFYVMCAMAMMCLRFTLVPEHERKNFVAVIPHCFAHVFFVHLYAVLASMLFVVVVFARMVVRCVQSRPPDQEQALPTRRHDATAVKRMSPKPLDSSREEREDHTELLRKLLAAKAAGSAV